MPVYEFKCPKCGERAQATLAFGSQTRPACITCGTITKRVFSATGVVFKGNGFYKTDNRRKSQ